MGVGTNILGYCNDQVDNEVKSVIDRSNMSTLNCPEEVKLCEVLIEMNLKDGQALGLEVKQTQLLLGLPGQHQARMA